MRPGLEPRITNPGRTSPRRVPQDLISMKLENHIFEEQFTSKLKKKIGVSAMLSTGTIIYIVVPRVGKPNS